MDTLKCSAQSCYSTLIKKSFEGWLLRADQVGTFWLHGSLLLLSGQTVESHSPGGHEWRKVVATFLLLSVMSGDAEGNRSGVVVAAAPFEVGIDFTCFEK